MEVGGDEARRGKTGTRWSPEARGGHAHAEAGPWAGLHTEQVLGTRSRVSGARPGEAPRLPERPDHRAQRPGLLCHISPSSISLCGSGTRS